MSTYIGTVNCSCPYTLEAQVNIGGRGSGIVLATFFHEPDGPPLPCYFNGTCVAGQISAASPIFCSGTWSGSISSDGTYLTLEGGVFDDRYHLELQAFRSTWHQDAPTAANPATQGEFLREASAEAKQKKKQKEVAQ